MYNKNIIRIKILLIVCYDIYLIFYLFYIFVLELYIIVFVCNYLIDDL